MLFILALFAWLSAGQAAPTTADLVLENANIYTGNSKAPKASFLAVAQGRILHVGDRRAELISPATRRIDLRGSTVVPGLIDSHAHLAGLGEMLENLNLRGVDSVARITGMIKAAAAQRPKGEWIRGRAWDQTNWGGQFPDSREISEAAPDHPAYLTRVDGHAAWVNRRALQIAEITRETADPPGGKIHRDSQGEPTGILVDRAMALVSRHIPKGSVEQLERQLRRAAEECAKLGLTGIHDAGVGREELEAYRKLVAQKQMPLRIYAMIRGAGDLWREYLKRGPEISDRLTVRSIKLVADGAMGSRGAALREPYSDDPSNKGLLMLSKGEIEAVARDAVRYGFQVNTHAIGDQANATVLDSYSAVLEPGSDKRFRIEHAQIVAPADFERFRQYSVIASIQSTHATSDMRWAALRLGDARVKSAWSAKSFLDHKVRITNGSDFPVEDPNPLWGFYAAITRQDHAGKPPGAFRAEERLSAEQALRSWTLDGAYAAFEEKDKGTLEAGKMADFVVLSADILRIPAAEILKTRVLTTFVDGQIVYSAPNSQ